MSHTLSFVLTLCLMSFSLSGFANSKVPPAMTSPPQIDEINTAPSRLHKSPYKVTGVACLEGEHCELIEEGEYKGYYLKSNMPLDDPRIENIQGNMFTKAVLDREKGKLNNKIEDLKELAESCKGDVCVAKYDSQGCNVCSLNVSQSSFPCFTAPNGEVRCTGAILPNSPASYDIDYLCNKRGCTGSADYMARLAARAGMCVKYGPNPLPQVGREVSTSGEVSEVNIYESNVLQNGGVLGLHDDPTRYPNATTGDDGSQQ